MVYVEDDMFGGWNAVAVSSIDRVTVYHETDPLRAAGEAAGELAVLMMLNRMGLRREPAREITQRGVPCELEQAVSAQHTPHLFTEIGLVAEIPERPKAKGISATRPPAVTRGAKWQS